jgi:hypothetical protein
MKEQLTVTLIEHQDGLLKKVCILKHIRQREESIEWF